MDEFKLACAGLRNENANLNTKRTRTRLLFLAPFDYTTVATEQHHIGVLVYITSDYGPSAGPVNLLSQNKSGRGLVEISCITVPGSPSKSEFLPASPRTGSRRVSRVPRKLPGTMVHGTYLCDQFQPRAPVPSNVSATETLVWKRHCGF